MLENIENKTLNAAMLQADFYDHPVAQIQLIETHISRVYLTGEYAYKIKKPVNFGFLDFSTLQQREFYCQEEIRLNRRLAPEIYLDVMPITQAHGQLQLNGSGKVIEYAIRMRQFEADSLFSRLIDENKINLQHIQSLARRIADFHAQIHSTGADNFGSADEIIKPVEDNFRILAENLSDPAQRQQLDRIRNFATTLHAALINAFNHRKQSGHIRECHGDLHLGNISLSDEKIIIFDGIEFNDSLRWIDTISDLAFLLMDLQDHQHPDYATHLLNLYLQTTGDYDGLQVLRFYQCYRAMVRAKVIALRLRQTAADESKQTDLLQPLQNYLNLAQGYINNAQPFLAITFGVSGSGKSWLSQNIADLTAAIVVRSDVERKRLFAADTDALYTTEISHRVYTHMLSLAEHILNQSYPVILDATFLDKHWRTLARELALRLHMPFYILHCHADPEILQQRITSRKNDVHNISDADLSVLQRQLATLQALDSSELPHTLSIRTDNDIKFAKIQQRLTRHY